MPTIEIDPDVLEAVKARALPWTDRSPSDTLRRLLGLGERASADTSPAPLPPGAAPEIGGRARKADLGTLVDAGLLADGQTVYLRNYSGGLVPGVEAQIASPNKLVWNRRRYSMSNLAAAQLKQAGYAGQAVRGPAHWITGEGKSILELWREYSKTARAQ